MVESFRLKLAAIADIANMSLDDIVTMWKNYARQCSVYDQSPVLSEFLEWNFRETNVSMEQLYEVI